MAENEPVEQPEEGAHKGPSTPGFMSDKFYDIVKWCALIVFPAIGSLYLGLAQLWDLPNADKVVATIVLIDTFLGVVIGVTKSAYDNSDARFDGDALVAPDPDNDQKTNVRMLVSPEALLGKDQLVLKVKRDI